MAYRGPLTTTQRGYGNTHQARRKALLPSAYGTACPYCGDPMLPGQALDLDHTTPLVLGGVQGDRIAHASCNRSAGARLGNLLRSRGITKRTSVEKREW